MKQVLSALLLFVSMQHVVMAQASDGLNISEFSHDGRVHRYSLSVKFLNLNQRKINLPTAQYAFLLKKMETKVNSIKAGGDPYCLPSDHWELDFKNKIRSFCTDAKALNTLKEIAADLTIIGRE